MSLPRFNVHGARINVLMERKEAGMRKGFPAAVALSLALCSPAFGQDKAEAVLKDMRQALGGDKLTAARSMTLEGTFARELGQGRHTGGDLVVTIALPDKMLRTELVKLPGGVTFERTSANNGTAGWEEIKG